MSGGGIDRLSFGDYVNTYEIYKDLVTQEITQLEFSHRKLIHGDHGKHVIIIFRKLFNIDFSWLNKLVDAIWALKQFLDRIGLCQQLWQVEWEERDLPKHKSDWLDKYVLEWAG